MTLLDLSYVTQSLVTLIKKSVQISPAWDGTEPTVTPRPADLLPGDAIGFYLYHVAENAHYRNAPPPGSTNGIAPVALTPMGLDAFYQLTVRSATNTDDGVYREQLLMGLAIKALRDNAMIDETTSIGGTDVFPAAIKSARNRFRIVLRTLEPNEAVAYWTAGSQPLRFAAYYQVSVILLEEVASVRTGRVLDYGLAVFPSLGPRIEGSSSTLSFIRPGEPARDIELRPAQLPVGDTFSLTGAGLSGTGLRLILRGHDWPAPVEVSGPWMVGGTPDRVHATVQATAGAQNIVPGIYGARIALDEVITRSDGTTELIERRSNETPFVVTPSAAPIGPPTSAGMFTINGGPFDVASSVEVIAGSQPLAYVTTALPGNGEFQIVGTPERIRFKLPTGLPLAGTPIRVVVNSVEGPPLWTRT